MSWLEWVLIFGILALLKYPLGTFIGKVLQKEKNILDPITTPMEKNLYRWMHVQQHDEMDWRQYASAFLMLNLLGGLLLYLILRFQGLLFLNPQAFPGVDPYLAFNTAMSFITNTNWQSYSGETTMSNFSQMVGLTPQNFLSAASGIAVFAALTRGIQRNESSKIGNFWVDVTRTLLYLLVPLSIIWTVLLMSQGVPQTFSANIQAEWLQPGTKEMPQQEIAIGPVASQEAIKLLGTNGGGFFNTNSAHPYENPTPVSNLLEIIAILLIPVSLTMTYGYMIKDLRQGWALLATMCLIYFPLLIVCYYFELQSNPELDNFGIMQERIYRSPGGNMEGKEIRFGLSGSTLWAVSTTATSCGAVNSMHDSYSPVAGMILLTLMKVGEVIFGGVGSGIYGILAYVIVGVFIAGLMVGRTPEYFGKKIEAFEVKMASIILLTPILTILFGTALAFLMLPDKAGALNIGPHAFSEVLYAFTSASNNNGSAFAGLDANNTFYNVALGVCMFLGRFVPAICALAIAGSMAAKKSIPISSGSLPTHTPLFVFWLAGIILALGALSYLPALALGPIVEHLRLINS